MAALLRRGASPIRPASVARPRKNVPAELGAVAGLHSCAGRLRRLRSVILGRAAFLFGVGHECCFLLLKPCAALLQNCFRPRTHLGTNPKPLNLQSAGLQRARTRQSPGGRVPRALFRGDQPCEGLLPLNTPCSGNLCAFTHAHQTCAHNPTPLYPKS